jgi:hypothetical protein
VFADPERSAAALGLMPTGYAAACYFAAKEELHRRFTNDQRLGNVFDMSGLADIQTREPVQEFLQDACILFRGKRREPTREEITVAVRDLADRYFGSAPEETR